MLREFPITLLLMNQAKSKTLKLLSILITTGFGFYIDHFSRYNALYGSIGTLPIIMLMIFCYSLAIIIGFELNIGIVTARNVNLIEETP